VGRTIYSSIQQVTNSITESSNQYERVVLVQYPRQGIYSLGLVTGTSPKEATKTIGTTSRNVFFPGSPNPTQGRLVMIPEENIHETELSVRQGIQFLMTTGMAQDKSIIELDEDQIPVDPEQIGSGAAIDSMDTTSKNADSEEANSEEGS
jgi:uncharacterized membrane protein